MILRSTTIDSAISQSPQILSGHQNARLALNGPGTVVDGGQNPALSTMLSAINSRQWSLALNGMIQFLRKSERQQPANERVQDATFARSFANAPEPEKSQLVRSNTLTETAKKKSPKTLQELIDLMRQLGATDGYLKAVGAGFAFSDIHDTSGYRVSLAEYLNNPLELDLSLLNDPTATNLCSFEGGATIEILSRHLWNQGKALLNQPGYEKLTFIGTANAGGHGSGNRLGPVSDALRSLHLLTFDQHNRVVEKQIEPSNGISNAERFHKKHPHIELIQDDSAFQTAIVSMGSIGVIYSAIIEIQDAFYLREDRVLRRWSEIRATLPALLADKELHSFHVWFNPYKVSGEQDCLLSTYRLADSPGTSRSAERGIGIRLGANQSMINTLLRIARNCPKSAPIIIREALRATASKNVILPCWQALNLGPPNRLKLSASEYGVAIERGIEAAEELSKVFQERAASTGAHLLSPFALRFVKGSNAFMSPMYGRDTCMLEMPLLDGLRRQGEFLQLFWDTLAPFGARPHWGQRNNVDASNVCRLFPRYAEFKAQVHKLNRGKMFDSAFTTALGLTGKVEHAEPHLAADTILPSKSPTLRSRHLDHAEYEKMGVRRVQVSAV